MGHDINRGWKEGRISFLTESMELKMSYKKHELERRGRSGMHREDEDPPVDRCVYYQEERKHPSLSVEI